MTAFWNGPSRDFEEINSWVQHSNKLVGGHGVYFEGGKAPPHYNDNRDSALCTLTPYLK
jgi:hypothetical protein